MSFQISCFADEIDEKLSVQLSELARQGIRWLELRGADGQSVAQMSAGKLREIKKRLSRAGVGVSAIGSPAGKYPIDGEFAPHYAMFVRMLEAAQIMETQYVRVFSFYIPKGGGDRFDEVCARLEKMTDAARAAGVVLLHENEKGIYGDTAERCAKLFGRLYCENFKMTFDPANFVQCSQPVPEAYELLKDYIEYVHIKDARFSDGSVTPAGMGDGEIRFLLSGLRERGFSGFLSIEPHLGDFTGFAELENGGRLDFLPGTPAAERFALACDSLRKILKEI